MPGSLVRRPGVAGRPQRPAGARHRDVGYRGFEAHAWLGGEDAIEGVGFHVEGALGVTAAKFATTLGAVHEPLPLVDGDLALIFERRLDNREEIRHAVSDRGIGVRAALGDGVTQPQRSPWNLVQPTR